MINLETERLIIRDHIISDLESHHKLFSDKKIMYYLSDIMTNSLDESKNNLEIAIKEINNPNRELYFFKIEEKLSKKHVGEIGYTVTGFTPLGKIVNIGYFTFSSFWGKGYVTEALNEVINFAFTKNDVYRICTGCLKENIASEKVMLKAGMIKEAEFKEYIWHDNKLKDRVEYRLLKHEWT